MSNNHHTNSSPEHNTAHKPNHKRRRKHKLCQTTLKQSSLSWTPRRTAESSKDTTATRRNSPETGTRHSTNGCSASSSTGWRKSKRMPQNGTSDLGTNSMSLPFSIGVGFAAGLVLVLLGYWFGYNVRSVEKIGERLNNVRYILPSYTEHLPQETLTRVSL